MRKCSDHEAQPKNKKEQKTIFYSLFFSALYFLGSYEDIFLFLFFGSMNYYMSHQNHGKKVMTKHKNEMKKIKNIVDEKQEFPPLIKVCVLLSKIVM